MGESIRNKTIKGIAWSAIERFSVQGVSFLVQIVLARLLAPSDYGIIAILAIFLQVAQVFIDSGFANALIKKSNCSEEDFSTVFWYNLGISLFLYVILFITAPFVSIFYKNDIITTVFRVISLTIIINAFSIVQQTKLIKAVDFKSQSKVTLISSISSGIIGILLAYKGFGVWALVYQQISNGILRFILYIGISKWFPSIKWSNSAFKYVFNFGSRLLAASLISVIYKNLYSLVIGKRFTSADLGYFNRADSFAMFPSNNIGNIISRVSFPIFSSIQDDNEQLLYAYRKLIRYSSFIIFPLMFGLLAVSEPFILVTLTEKWKLCIIILQILCIDWSLDHITLLNLNLLYVKGKTDLVLKLELIKKTIAITILVVSIPLGLIAMCWGRVLYSVIATILNTYYTNKLLNFGFLKQVSDFSPFIIASVFMAVLLNCFMKLFNDPIEQLISGIVIGIIIYFIISLLFFRSIITDLISMIKKKL